MKTIVLFGGGDAGGLLITEGGVRPIPPFDLTIRQNLKAVAAIVSSASAASDTPSGQKLGKLATNICNVAVGLVEEVLGPLDPERAIIFQDSDGGFTCGSVGKPPIPFPWPPLQMPSLQDFIASGAAEEDMVSVIQKARSEGISFTNVFEHPTAVAKKMGLKLSKKAAADLSMLAPSKINKIRDETDRNIVKFFHAVVDDGRYLDTWLTRPYEVSKEINFDLDEKTLERLVTRGGLSSLRGGAVSLGPMIVIIIVVIVVDRVKPPRDIVVDRSGRKKI